MFGNNCTIVSYHKTGTGFSSFIRQKGFSAFSEAFIFGTSCTAFFEVRFGEVFPYDGSFVSLDIRNVFPICFSGVFVYRLFGLAFCRIAFLNLEFIQRWLLRSHPLLFKWCMFIEDLGKQCREGPVGVIGVFKGKRGEHA